jgi:hypothetical protein
MPDACVIALLLASRVTVLLHAIDTHWIRNSLRLSLIAPILTPSESSPHCKSNKNLLRVNERSRPPTRTSVQDTYCTYGLIWLTRRYCNGPTTNGTRNTLKLPNVLTYGQPNPDLTCAIFLQQGQGQKKAHNYWNPRSTTHCSADRLSSGYNISSSLLGLLYGNPVCIYLF